MRAMLIALLGLGLVSGPALAERAHSRAPATVKAPRLTGPRLVAPVRATAARAAHKVATAHAPKGSAGYRAATPSHKGARYAASRPRFGKGGFVGRAHASTMVRSVGWHHGLPPAAGVQADECPAGTMATLARGHDDVVRCMPI